MRSLVRLFSIHADDHPARVPVLVSTTGILAALAFSSLTVYFGLNHNGTFLIAAATSIATLITVPAGYSHYKHECHIAEQNEQLRLLASRDPLTGLLNRRAFYEAAWTARQNAAHTDQRAAIIGFDLDWFKDVNDTYGHEVGDLVLRKVAKVARHAVPSSDDLIARWGGEEFVLFLNGLSQDQAIQLAENLRAAISALSFGDAAPGLSVSASFGVIPMDAGCDLDDALRRADHAVYDAKRAGRNRTVAPNLAVAA